ncbi:DUF4055 domain-containing protein [Nitrosomonas sp. Is35]|uniref:DUF4055 domain-containing protein n=1 Tax=Nitrosomonas sp. Is35 TaxID=3080534 RepID=UPI00294AE76B|nr:DUF4055 domain-containing protein [Nitrosomonas sp. Is35]MDV6347487.1 DUF4055 domain-containing protein [Nitrosomonas sp. Is35]
MSVKNTHPDYDESMRDMQTVRDFYKGERHVKGKTVTYLSPTVAQTLDGLNQGEPGAVAYKKYIEGARVPWLVKEKVENAIGTMHKENATINVPVKMEPLLNRITRHGESVHALIRRMNEEQLIAGRLGLLLDSDEKTDLPYISLYYGESITNWDEGILQTGTVASLRMVVLSEPTTELDSDYKWTTKDTYRVLSLAADKNGKNVFVTGKFEDEINQSEMKPVLLFGRPLEEIPFVFVNSKDNLPTPDMPPLLGLANKVLGIYRSEANYRYHLYMQSQDTLVRIGYMPMGVGDETTNNSVRTGAGACIDVGLGGDAHFTGVNSKGLTEERLALENDYKRAEDEAMKLLDKRSVESNDALVTRKGSQAASLTQIAKSSAAAVEKMLKLIANWMQLDPDEVVVTPFTDFGDVTITAKDVIDMKTAQTMGAPISDETIHERMREGGMTDKTYEQELEALAGQDGGLQ